MVSLINNFCLLQKRLKRQKALVQSTSISNEEKRRFKDCMNVEYMSSEHSVSEDNADDRENSSEDENVPKKKVLCRRPLPWRSQELNNFFVKLDRKANRKRSQRSASMMIERRDGSPSEREAPDDAPEFAKEMKGNEGNESYSKALEVILTNTCSSANITALNPSQSMVLF